MGVQIEYSHHEVAPSQHEVDMCYKDALQMADSVITYRVAVKEIANKFGVYATLMPNPRVGQKGPGVNSYKRLGPGYEAPVYIAWSRRNRSALIRVPDYHPGQEKATRCEFRACDPSCNPYLTFAAMLHAGLEGIEKKYKVPAPMEKNLYHLTDTERKEKGIETLPDSLGYAIAIAEDSALVKKILGEHIFPRFIEIKKKEWNDYRIQVSEYELNKYLPIN